MEKSDEKEKRGEKRDLAAHTSAPEVSLAKKACLEAPLSDTNAHAHETATSGTVLGTATSVPVTVQGEAMINEEPSSLCAHLSLLSSNFRFSNTLS